MHKTTSRHATIAAALLGLAGCGGNDPATFEAPPTELQPTTILEAVLAGDTSAVRAFVTRGADVNAPEADGTTLLMRAIHGGTPQIAALLIDAGANVAARNRYGVSALYLAARGGEARATRDLLAAGADPNTALPEGESVLMTAAKTGSIETVRALLGDPASYAASPDAIASSGYSAASAPGVVARVQGADPNAKEPWHGQTALMWAAAEGHAEIVRLLLAAGANVNEQSADGLTALLLARANGHFETATLLVEAGADARDAN